MAAQEQQTPMGPGPRLALTAQKALTDVAFDGIAGHCQHFVRECIRATFGHSFDHYLLAADGSFEPSAYEAMLRWEQSPYVIWRPGDGPWRHWQPGDVYYKGRRTSGPYGHTGIGFDNLVDNHPLYAIAENSGYHIDPSHEGDVSGAKGWRSLDAFGPFELVVRLR